MWQCEVSLPNTLVVWRLEIVKCEQCCWCAQHAFDFTVLRGVWVGLPELYVVGKEELPRGGVIKLTHIVALDTLDLATELSTDKREELGDS
jgi:hypothetical protein